MIRGHDKGCVCLLCVEEAGRRIERAVIVAAMRALLPDLVSYDMRAIVKHLADCYERGDHLSHLQNRKITCDEPAPSAEPTEGNESRESASKRRALATRRKRSCSKSL